LENGKQRKVMSMTNAPTQVNPSRESQAKPSQKPTDAPKSPRALHQARHRRGVRLMARRFATRRPTGGQRWLESSDDRRPAQCQPSGLPSGMPSRAPSRMPRLPSAPPTRRPTGGPTRSPSKTPSSSLARFPDSRRQD
jgi:hypothetical protein